MSGPTLSRIRAELFSHQDKPYREFNIKCNPAAEHSIGVRIPIIRRLAKTLVKSDFTAYLEDVANEEGPYFEETMLEGIIIATAPISTEERLTYLRAFVAKIRDWGICDSVCASFKLKTPEEYQTFWDFITEYKTSTREFELRFMLVMMLDHFLTSAYLPEIFTIIKNLKSHAHYTDMAAAWLLAEAMVDHYEPTKNFLLETSSLPDFIFRKSISKARESYRISSAQKKELLVLAKTRTR